MSREVTASWGGPSQLGETYWGLSRKIGPWTATAADARRTQSGGPHAGHGNWWQSYNPKPYIQTTPVTGLPKYKTFDVVFDIDFETPLDAKIPAIKGNRTKREGGYKSKYARNSTLEALNNSIRNASHDPNLHQYSESSFPRMFSRNDSTRIETGSGYRHMDTMSDILSYQNMDVGSPITNTASATSATSSTSPGLSELLG